MKISSKVIDYTSRFGLVNGLKVYLSFKYKKDVSLTIPSIKQPVHLRYLLTRSDLLMFEQVFIRNDYNIKVPFEPKVILDLGVNVGFASIYFANRFPGATITGLEPNYANYQAALHNTRDYPNINVINGAVWNSVKDLFVVDRGFGEAAFMITEEAEANSQPINGFTIKGLLEKINVANADIIKIDIEGAELEVFQSGYEQWLPNTKIVIVETHDRYRRGTSKAVFEAFGKYDFSLEISGENLVFYNNELMDTSFLRNA